MIDVHERCTGAEAVDGHPGSSRDVFEGSVAAIPVKPVRAHLSVIEVLLAVAIVIADRATYPVAGGTG